MCKYLSLRPSGFELMVIAGFEEVNLIGVNTQGPYLANLYNNAYTALGHATSFEASLQPIVSLTQCFFIGHHAESQRDFPGLQILRHWFSPISVPKLV